MMPIPERIIEIVNSALGFAGRPHVILYEGQWVDTGCLEWTSVSTPHSIMGETSPALMDTIKRWHAYTQAAWSEISPEVLDAIRRWVTAIMGTVPYRNPDLPDGHPEYDTIVASKTLEFFDREPAAIRAEFNRFMDQLGDRPSLYRATYRYGTTFFDAVQEIRTRQFFEKEPPAIKEEFERFMASMRDASSYEHSAQQARKAGFRANTLSRVRRALRNEPVLVYQTGHVGANVPTAIVVAGTTDQFDVLRIERTEAGNYGLQTEEVIAKLRFLDENYGIDIIGAGWDSVELVLKRMPRGRAARELQRWLLEFCPDLDQAPESSSKRKVSLWWD